MQLEITYEKIKTEFPKAWQEFVNWAGHSTFFDHNDYRELYDFFNTQGIILFIIPSKINFNRYSYEIYPEGDKDENSLRIFNFDAYKSLHEAEKAGFFECLGILEDRLCNSK